MADTLRHPARPWLLLWAAVAVLLTWELTGRSRVREMGEGLVRMEETVEHLRQESRALRRELGRVRLEMAAQIGATPSPR